MRKLVVAMILVAACAPGETAAQQAGADGVRYIFFDWGKPELNGDARKILDDVAAAHGAAPAARLQLDGHSDRSGRAAHNRRSSLRRAESARAYLVARGVPQGAITVAAHGEERPYVATADGVREGQNRRVEIRFAQ